MPLPPLTTIMSAHVSRLLLRACMVLWLLPGLSTAAPAPLTLPQAVELHEAGRHAEARRAFEQLWQQQRLPAAAFNLGVLHLQAPGKARRTALAMRYLQAAADAGFVTAQFTLGRIHEEGLAGPRDLAKALEWYERAAEAGSPEARLAAATAHYLGRGTTRSAARAMHWYKAAAQAGDGDAAYIVAAMFEHGDGVPPDLQTALPWYELAAASGDIAARARLRALNPAGRP